jgi:lipid-A-disaccharide synthase-like uncharacterized protein
MFWKAIVFWFAVLFGLVLLSYFVPETNSIPQYLIVLFLLVIAVGYLFIIRRNQLRARR